MGLGPIRCAQARPDDPDGVPDDPGVGGPDDPDGVPDDPATGTTYGCPRTGYPDDPGVGPDDPAEPG
jgi:hypothetical protein